MKIFRFILIFGFFFIVSCEKNPEDITNVIQHQSSLTTNLTQFNNKYKTNFNNDIQLRGFWKTLAGVVAVAGADVIGAGAGIYAGKEIAALAGAATGGTGAAVVAGVCGVLGAAGTSIAAGNQVFGLIYNPNSNNSFNPVEYYENLAIQYPVEFSEFNNIGHNHNKKLFLYSTTGLLYNNNNEIEQYLNSNSEWIEVTNKLEESILKYESQYENDIYKLIDDLYNDSLISFKMKEVYYLFFNAYQVDLQENDLINLINYYITSISSSNELSITEKRALISSFSVASESPFWWLNQTF